MKHSIRSLTLFFFLVFPFITFAQDIDDPIEPVNRGIFWVNDQFDVYLFEPVARGYDTVVPNIAQTGVKNFFNNLRYPVNFVSDMVQFKFTQAAEHTGRFLINTTVGVGGIIDVAQYVGLEEHKEDFGIALAYHGVPPGPYLVLPLLGPSNLRDTVGKIVDTVVNPFDMIFYTIDVADAVQYTTTGLRVLDAIQTRTDLIPAIETAKETSVDYYSFAQSSYYQFRRGLLYDGNPPDEEDYWDEESVDDSPDKGASPDPSDSK